MLKITSQTKMKGFHDQSNKCKGCALSCRNIYPKERPKQLYSRIFKYWSVKAEQSVIGAVGWSGCDNAWGISASPMSMFFRPVNLSTFHCHMSSNILNLDWTLSLLSWPSKGTVSNCVINQKYSYFLHNLLFLSFNYK